jgi:hypothetical protein
VPAFDEVSGVGCPGVGDPGRRRRARGVGDVE